MQVTRAYSAVLKTYCRSSQGIYAKSKTTKSLQMVVGYYMNFDVAKSKNMNILQTKQQ